VTLAKAMKRALNRPLNFSAVVTLLGVIAVIVILIPNPPELSPTSSSVLAVTLGDGKPGTDPSGRDKLIYLADRSNGRVVVFRSNSLRQVADKIPIGTQGNVEGQGKPESLLQLRRGGLNLIFVADTAGPRIHIIEVGSNSEIQPGLPVGSVPRSMAITKDKKKLFVSHEQTVPNAGIMVYDISSDDPKNFHFVTEITGVNCPEGIVLSPYSDRLYVAAQCGGAEDPVFIIDTAKNLIVDSIPHLAVGTSVAVNRDGSRLYVGRGNYPSCKLADTNETGSPLSVVDLSDHNKIINTICLRTSVGVMTISQPDGRYLYVANGTILSVFDTKRLDVATKSLNDIPLEAAVEGLSAAADGSVYAYLPASNRLFLYSPAGLSPGQL
jgi:DNA-binding beta-propeller fold protein YncE